MAPVPGLVFRLVLIAALAPIAATSAAGLSEADAIARALDNPEISRLLAARSAAAAGRAADAGRWANPELEYSREGLDEPDGDSTETFLSVRQRWNPAGARGLERRAAAEGLVADRARIELERRDLVMEVRQRFHHLGAALRRRAAHAAFHERLAALVTAAERRAEAGESAPFDALRLRRALAVAEGDLGLADAETRIARAQLATLLGDLAGDAANDPEGSLLPPAPDLVDAADDDPRLRALQAEARAADLRARAAQRDAWPDLEIGLGVREFEQAGRSFDGGLLTIGVELPLFDRNRGRIDAARADAIGYDAERRLAARRLETESSVAAARLAAARAAALALASIAADDSGALEEIADAAYAAGELDVLALIDAHRSTLDARLRAIEYARTARDAYIQLQFLGRTP